MTTIDRAGLAAEIERIAKHWRGANGGIFTIHAMSLEMAEKLEEWFAASLRTTTEAGGVDGQVLLAAAQMDDAQKSQPEWLWYSEERTSFGRWKKAANQAPYIRVDLAIPDQFLLDAPQPASVAGKMPSEEEMAMLIRMLVRHFPKDLEIRRKAVDYLTRHGLLGSPLRSPAEPHDVDGERVPELHKLDAGKDGDEFAIGDPVEKFTGEALWEGDIRAVYRTGKGSLRYVVEVKPQGFQMIAVPSQLRRAARFVDEEGRCG